MKKKTVEMLLISICCLSIEQLSATSYTWNGGASGNWNVNANWLPNTGFPGAADTAHFTTPSSLTVTLPSAQNVNQLIQSNNVVIFLTNGTLSFNAPSPQINMGGNNMQFNGTHSVIALANTTVQNGTLILFNSAGLTSSPNTVEYIVDAVIDVNGSGSAASFLVNGAMALTGSANAPLLNISATGSVGLTRGNFQPTGASTVIMSGTSLFNDGGSFYTGGSTSTITITGGACSNTNGGNFGGNNTVSISGGSFVNSVSSYMGDFPGFVQQLAALNISGTAAITNDNTSSIYVGGTTSMTGGSLLNDGIVQSSGGFNLSAGTVSGVGHFDQINNTGALIDPGDFDATVSGNIGTLSVGTFAQSAGTLQINFHDGDFLGFLALSSPASFGGTLNINGLTGFNALPNTQYEIISAPGGFAGMFALTSSNLPAGVIPLIDYSTGVSVLLSFLGLPNPNPGPSSLPPTLSSFPGGSREVLFASINHLNAFYLPKQMKRLKSARPSAGGEVSYQITQLEKGDTHLVSLEEGSEITKTSLGRAVEEKQEQMRRQIGEEARNPFCVYLANIDSKGDLLTHASQPGFDYQSMGVLAGGDYAFSYAGLGFALAYEKIDAAISHGWGRFDIDQLHGSLYLTSGSSQGKGIFFNAILGAGYDWYTFDRSVSSTTNIQPTVAQGNTRGNEFDVLMGLEYVEKRTWCNHELSLIPLVSLQYIFLNVAGYDETGAGASNLTISSQHAKSLRSTLGGRIDYTWRWGNIEFVPELLLGWQYEFLDRDTSLAFVPLSHAIPGSSVEILGGGRNIVFGGVDILLTYHNRLSLEVGYDYEWNAQYQDHSIYAGLNVRF